MRKLLLVLAAVSLQACAARQIKPITAETTLSAEAVAASGVGLRVLSDRTNYFTNPTTGKLDSTRVVVRGYVNPLDVVASRDSVITIKTVEGDTVVKEIKATTSNATVAKAEKDLRTHEITTRGKSDRTDSKNRWPCLIGCGGMPVGAAGYSSYDYSYSQGMMRNTPLPAGCQVLTPGSCTTGFGHVGGWGNTGQNVIATPNGVYPIRP